MSIKLNAKNVRDAISRIRSAFGTDLQNIQIDFPKGEHMRIGVSSASLSVLVSVEGCEGKGRFGVTAETFNRILQGRSTLECKLTDDSLTFKENRFSGEIKVFPYVKVEVTPETSEKTQTIPHNSGIAQHFTAARSCLSLSSNQGEIPIFVRVMKGKLECWSFDDFHSGMYSSAIDSSSEYEFNIQESALRKIQGMTRKDASYTMIIGESSVFIESENIKASLSMMQTSQSRAKYLCEMVEALKAQENMKARAFIKTSELSGIVSNMTAIVEDQKFIKLQIDSGLTVRFQTSYGKVKETFEAKSKGKSEVNVTPFLMLSMLDTIPDGEAKVSIASMPGSNANSLALVVEVPEANVTYVMAVN